MFREAHKNQAIKDLYSNMNHLNKLTSQLEYLRDAITDNTTVRVAYTGIGQPTAATIKDNHAILDAALYQTKCKSEDEACYLTAIINSNKLAAAAETFMSRGLYGARNFHKHGWKLPIPRYDASDALHLRLSETRQSRRTRVHGHHRQQRHHVQAGRRRPVPRRPQDATPRMATYQPDRPRH